MFMRQARGAIDGPVGARREVGGDEDVGEWGHDESFQSNSGGRGTALVPDEGLNGQGQCQSLPAKRHLPSSQWYRQCCR